MSSFSQRQGLVPLEKAIQKDSMDDDLRNSLWNLLLGTAFAVMKAKFDKDSDTFYIKKIWSDFFKKRTDEILIKYDDIYQSAKIKIGKYFFNAKWNEVYDFIEFIFNMMNFSKVIKEGVNRVLERENSAY